MQRLLALIVFIVLVVLTVALGSQFEAGDWYQAVKQPGWGPSPALLVIVWSLVYVLLAASAWMVWDRAQSVAHKALVWWLLQLVASVVWSWVYFGLHRVGWAMAVMGVWLLLSLITARSFRQYRPEASSLMLPVVIWLVFALALNFTQWTLNGGGVNSIF